jgi:hypothetical protein
VTRFTWGIVIGVLALVAVSIGLAVLLPRGQPTPDLSTPDGVVLAYGLAMQRGDAEAAWELLSTEAQGRTTRERFIARAGGFIPNYERVRVSVEDTRETGDTARVQLVRTFSGAGGPFGLGGGPTSTRSAVSLVRENGAWRISMPPEGFLLEPDRP